MLILVSNRNTYAKKVKNKAGVPLITNSVQFLLSQEVTSMRVRLLWVCRLSFIF